MLDEHATATDRARVYARLEFEPLLFHLAKENLERAKVIQEESLQAEETKKRDLELQVLKYSAASIVFADATVESYVNWMLEHRMLSHHDDFRRMLGEMIGRIRFPTSMRWINVIEAAGLLVTQKWEKASDQIRQDAEWLTNLRNFIVHSKGRLRPTDKLQRKVDGRVVTETEERVTRQNAEKAIRIARDIIKELHRLEKTHAPSWLE